MAAISSPDWTRYTGEAGTFGWIHYSCGCSYKDHFYPHRCTSVEGPCAMCAKKDLPEREKNEIK